MMWLIWSNAHGGWWRKGHGYTLDVREAERYAEVDAVAIVRQSQIEPFVTQFLGCVLSESMHVAPEWAWLGQGASPLPRETTDAAWRRPAEAT